ncbi:MAG: hypothetical protein HY856_10125 [Burkholderiales bacterium]|nr:hypothetical protein [Burkholderiales bacterium]
MKSTDVSGGQEIAHQRAQAQRPQACHAHAPDHASTIPRRASSASQPGDEVAGSPPGVTSQSLT